MLYNKNQHMIKKEITVAIVIGLVISAIIAGGILRAKSVLQNHQNQSTNPSQPQSSSNPNLAQDKQTQKLFLKLTSPKNNSVVDQASVDLSGETLPHTYIAIITDKSEYLIVPNDLGQFSQKIKLIKGANLIKVTVYTKTGEKVEKTLNLVYTNAKI